MILKESLTFRRGVVFFFFFFFVSFLCAFSKEKERWFVTLLLVSLPTGFFLSPFSSFPNPSPTLILSSHSFDVDLLSGSSLGSPPSLFPCSSGLSLLLAPTVPSPKSKRPTPVCFLPFLFCFYCFCCFCLLFLISFFFRF